MNQLRLIRLPELLHKIGYSRASLYKMVKVGVFPKPILIGPRAVAWSEESVDTWIKSKLEENKESER
jgi:prophage regulatory protein